MERPTNKSQVDKWEIYCLRSIKVNLPLSPSLSPSLPLSPSSWDDSSSVSSGISDNIDTDDINTSSSISSYANTPAAQRKGLSTQVGLQVFGLSRLRETAELN